MSCPTCDHTLHCIVSRDVGPSVHWCPRCGTIQTELAGQAAHTTPRLVGYVRTMLVSGGMQNATLAECCLPPSERLKEKA